MKGKLKQTYAKRILNNAILVERNDEETYGILQKRIGEDRDEIRCLFFLADRNW